MGLGGMGMEFAMGMGLGALGGINDNNRQGMGNNNGGPGGNNSLEDNHGGDANAGSDLDALAGIGQDFDFGLYLAALDEEGDTGGSNGGSGGNGEVIV